MEQFVVQLFFQFVQREVYDVASSVTGDSEGNLVFRIEVGDVCYLYGVEMPGRGYEETGAELFFFLSGNVFQQLYLTLSPTPLNRSRMAEKVWEVISLSWCRSGISA